MLARYGIDCVIVREIIRQRWRLEFGIYSVSFRKEPMFRIKKSRGLGKTPVLQDQENMGLFIFNR